MSGAGLPGAHQTRRPQDTLPDRPELGPVESITRANIEHFNSWIEQLHKHYGLKKPEFVQKKDNQVVGQTIPVVQATLAGHYPMSSLVATPKNVVTVNLWNRVNIFWTMDINDQRYIVARVVVGNFTGYRRWMGIQEGLGKRILAY